MIERELGGVEQAPEDVAVDHQRNVAGLAGAGFGHLLFGLDDLLFEVGESFDFLAVFFELLVLGLQ